MQLPWLVVRKQFYTRTNEDWCPNYSGSRLLVRVSEAWHPKRPDVFDLHISVWGKGNFGLHRWVRADEFNIGKKRKALIVEANSLPKPLSWVHLKDLGYQYC